MMQAAAGASPVVFVVDDDFDVREVLKSLLESVGLRAEVFGSTREFLQNKPMDTVSCLVLDVSLPGVSGSISRQSLPAPMPISRSSSSAAMAMNGCRSGP